MTDPLTGMAAVTARRSELSARIAALTGDAIVPGGAGGVFTTAAARTAPSSFASVLAAVAPAGDDAAGSMTPGQVGAVPGAVPGALPGGVVATAWSIPWLDGRVPAGPATSGEGTMSVARSMAAPGAGATGILPAAAGDDPLAVVRPLRGRVTQAFGPTDSVFSAPHTVNGVRYEHFHDGIDIAAPIGRPVASMAAGRVIFAGTYPDGANVVRVKHADGSVALYAHLGDGLDVARGDLVAAGQRLGVVGMSGNTTGPHLHLELLVKGEDTDPQVALERGRLPGRESGRIDASVLGPRSLDSATERALATFDAVAGDIPHATEIRAAAMRAGIDPLLLASLVRAESGFRAGAVSNAGAMGLCQLMPATARAMGVEDPFDPTQNLRAGARYLARNLEIYGRVDLALAAYQAGKGAVRAAGGIPDSPTTRHYIDRILSAWAGYQEDAA